jgi:hypothetical protein
LIIVSIGFAIFIVKTGIVHQFIATFDNFQYFSIILAGIFFTSAFTTAPSIALLGTFAETTPLPILVVLGGLGAVLGDYIIFRFVKDRVSEDIRYLLSFSKGHRFSAIFRTQLFRFFVPFVGALIIASPFPDEIGVAMLGLSRVKNRTFFLLSFVFNSVGIFAIGWLVKEIVGL